MPFDLLIMLQFLGLHDGLTQKPDADAKILVVDVPGTMARLRPQNEYHIVPERSHEIGELIDSRRFVMRGQDDGDATGIAENKIA